MLVKKYVALAGLKARITPHSIRHGTATELIRRGNGIEIVAQVLNHKNLNTTRKYVHLAGEAVHSAVASLADRVGQRRDAKPGFRKEQPTLRN